MLPMLEEIKTRREALQITQKMFAKMCGIKASMLNMVEKRNANPSYDLWVKIDSCLDNEEAKVQGREKTVGQLCISPFKFVRGADSIQDAIKIMKRNDISQLPVMSGSDCVGVITERSILFYEAKGGMPDTRVKDAMDIPPPIIDEKTPITPQLLALLSNSSCLLVSHKNKIDGIITKIDAIRGRKK